VGFEIDLSGVKGRINPRYWPLLWDEHRFLVMRGGAGSGKSVFAAQKILVRLAREVGVRHKFAVLRKVLNTQRHSTFAVFDEILTDWGWRDLCTINRGNLEITFLPTGGRIIFLGLDDREKLKSIAGITGVWIEEATELAEADLDQVNLRLRGKTTAYKQIMLSFNPISAEHWLKRRFFDSPRDRALCVFTTYKDNEYLDEEYRAELEALREVDLQLWRIYARGLWGVLRGLIYRPWPTLTDWPVAFERTFYGLDWGFNDPMALVRVDKRDGAYYVTELFYERGRTTADLIAALPGLGVEGAQPIYCDSAEPDRIEELCRAGYNAIPAHKAPGSLKAGISMLQAARIYTRPQNTNLTAEASTYKWAETKDGRLLEEPVDYRNHALDALRYAIYTNHMRAIGVAAGGYNPLPTP
jgi:phage terminase large subunit